MSAADALTSVRDSIVRGLSFDEPLIVATGLRPVAELDPTALSREEIAQQARRAENKVAGALQRVTDRFSAMTEPAGTDEAARVAALERARTSMTGGADSVAARLIRCWVGVSRDASYLYVSDRRWLVTMTVAAARGWRVAPQQVPPSEGLVRDLGTAARQLGRSLANDSQLTKGLDERAPNGGTALVVVWGAARAEVTAQASADGVWLAFADGSGSWVRPGRPEWPLAQRVEALRAAGIPVS